MIGRIAPLAAALFTASVGLAEAQTLSLPVGEWGHSSDHGVDCSPPFLKIEPDRVVKRLGGGEVRCPIKNAQKEGKYIRVHAACEFDTSIPIEYLAKGDDDDDSFTLIVNGLNEILFNNTPHAPCVPAGGVK